MRKQQLHSDCLYNMNNMKERFLSGLGNNPGIARWMRSSAYTDMYQQRLLFESLPSARDEFATIPTLAAEVDRL